MTMSDEQIGKDRTCRACGAGFVYPQQGSLATKRLCPSCAGLPEAVLRVLEAHQLEISRLKRALARARGEAG